MPGIFGDLFDLDSNGVVDGFEEALEIITINEMMNEEEKEKEDLFDLEDEFEEGENDEF